MPVRCVVYACAPTYSTMSPFFASGICYLIMTCSLRPEHGLVKAAVYSGWALAICHLRVSGPHCRLFR
jgi:hypothetical protein